MLELSIIGIFGSLIFIFYSLATSARDVRLRLKMKKRERQLRATGVTPSGSTLSHGICINKKTKRFKTDQQESLMWYKRLI